MFVIISVLFLQFLAPASSVSPAQDQSAELLVGTWQLDLTPQNKLDDNFANMVIHRVDGKNFYGEFYREGVKIQKGHINFSNGRISAALISEDNSGKYATSFYLKNGELHGTTHALERGFLAIWTAAKLQ